MFHEGYKPTLEEYFNTSVISVGGLINLFCSYFLTTDKITVEALNYIDQFPSIMKCPSMIARLVNDLATSSVMLNHTNKKVKKIVVKEVK